MDCQNLDRAIGNLTLADTGAVPFDYLADVVKVLQDIRYNLHETLANRRSLLSRVQVELKRTEDEVESITKDLGIWTDIVAAWERDGIDSQTLLEAGRAKLASCEATLEHPAQLLPKLKREKKILEHSVKWLSSELSLVTLHIETHTQARARMA
jgi:hypothetical protein